CAYGLLLYSHNGRRSLVAKEKPVNLDYDAAAETLYVSIGKPQEAVTIEPEEGILLRVHPDSGNLVGLTILLFDRRLRECGDRLAANIPLVPPDLIPTVIRR